MRKLKSAGSVLIALLAVLLSACSQKEDKVTPGAIYDEIKSADKMIVARMDVTKTIKSERNDWYKIGKRIAVYSYDTHLQAYIDMREFKPEDVEVDEASGVVTLYLPEVRTQVAGRDFTMNKEYENIGLLRSDLDSKERAEMKERANESLKKELARNPDYIRDLKETGRRKATDYFIRLFNESGHVVKIEFKE